MRKIEMKDFKDRLVNQDRRMSFSERIYLPAILKGMGVTIGHFFRKPETLQYPDERPNLSPRFRGLQELQVDENGEEKCVACPFSPQTGVLISSRFEGRRVKQ